MNIFVQKYAKTTIKMLDFAHETTLLWEKGEIKMYITNFLVFILCAMCAIWHGVNGNIAWLLVECGLAIANLPFAIKWIKEFMNDFK